jgi:hypothetical protein
MHMENNNKKYDKFYFLHIPKTGGRYFKKIAAYPLSLESKKKGKNLTFLIPPAHNGWIPEIDENTYVVSIVRDPVKLVCSWRLYFGNDGKNQGLDMNDEHFLKIVKDGMFSHLRKENWLHNFQSKNLTKHYKYFNGPENYEEVDEKLLYENLKRIDFLFTQDYLESNPVDVCRKIFSDHEESFPASELPEYNNFRQINSKILYDSLSEDEIEEIKSYFKLDIEIYNMVRNREV